MEMGTYFTHIFKIKTKMQLAYILLKSDKETLHF